MIAPNGDLFTAAWTDGGIVRYAAADLDTPGATPIGFVVLPGVSALAWHDGRQYAMHETHGVLLRFDRPDSILGDTVTGRDADVAIRGYSGTGSSAGLAFDPDGRLWMAFRQARVRLDDPTAPFGCTSTAPDAVMTLPAAAPRHVLTYRDGALYTAPCGLGTIERFDVNRPVAPPEAGPARCGWDGHVSCGSLLISQAAGFAGHGGGDPSTVVAR